MNLQKLSLRCSITDVVELFKMCKGFSRCNILSNGLVNDKNSRGLIFKFSILCLYSKPCYSFIVNCTDNV